MQFVYPAQDQVNRYEAKVERILEALGYDAADCAVSDESLLTDFTDAWLTASHHFFDRRQLYFCTRCWPHDPNAIDIDVGLCINKRPMQRIKNGHQQSR